MMSSTMMMQPYNLATEANRQRKSIFEAVEDDACSVASVSSVVLQNLDGDCHDVVSDGILFSFRPQEACACNCNCGRSQFVSPQVMQSSAYFYQAQAQVRHVMVPQHQQPEDDLEPIPCRPASHQMPMFISYQQPVRPMQAVSATDDMDPLPLHPTSVAPIMQRPQVPVVTPSAPHNDIFSFDSLPEQQEEAVKPVPSSPQQQQHASGRASVVSLEHEEAVKSAAAQEPEVVDLTETAPSAHQQPPAIVAPLLSKKKATKKKSSGSSNIVPTNLDVLSGKGARTLVHNRHFTTLCSRYADAYARTSKRGMNGKKGIALEIVRQVHANGGRFLKSTGPNSYEEINMELATDKVAHCIRDLVSAKKKVKR